jgi:hypothetical protein
VLIYEHSKRADTSMQRLYKVAVNQMCMLAVALLICMPNVEA